MDALREHFVTSDDDKDATFATVDSTVNMKPDVSGKNTNRNIKTEINCILIPMHQENVYRSLNTLVKETAR